MTKERKVVVIDPADPLAEFRIQEALTACRLIAATWGIKDVLEIRPDLSEEQAWEVLEEAKRRHDAGIGITWDVLQIHAENLFGRAPSKAEAGEGRP